MDPRRPPGRRGRRSNASSGRPCRASPGSPTGRARPARGSTPSSRGALAAVIFDDLERELHRSVDYAVLFRFRNAGRLDSYWVYRAETVGVPVPRGGLRRRSSRVGPLA